MGSEDNGLSSLGAQVMPRGVDWEKSRGGGWGGMTGWRRRSPRTCCNLCSASGLGCVGGGEAQLRIGVSVLEGMQAERRPRKCLSTLNTCMA